METIKALKRSCRDCGNDIWLHQAKSGKWYPCNSEGNRRDFHNCGKKQKVESEEPETTFGASAATRQLGLEFPTENDNAGSGLVAMVTFPASATRADVKAILARIGDDAQSIQIVQIVE